MDNVAPNRVLRGPLEGMRARVEPLSPLEYLTIFTAGWSSLVARRAHNPKVAGSNPAPATLKHAAFGRRLYVHLTASDWDQLQQTVRHRVLRYFHCHGLLERHVTDDMLTWQAAGGFSIDASVHIAAHDRAGLERLLRRVPAEGGWCPSSLRPRTARGYQLRCDSRRAHRLSSPASRTGWHHGSLAHSSRVPRTARSAHCSATHSPAPLSRCPGSQCQAEVSGHRARS